MMPLLLALALGCGSHDFADPTREWGPPVTGAPNHPVVVHVPTTLGVADAPGLDARGTPVGVSCATCHGPDPDRAWVADARSHDGFHTGVELRHGTLDCDFCHDPPRTGLHLADGTRVDFDDTLTLCAQCHGVQARDYRRGSHGGMAGYWDLRRGPRDRNHCVDCHAPHAPAYQPVMPVFPPRDRYLGSTEHPDGVALNRENH